MSYMDKGDFVKLAGDKHTVWEVLGEEPGDVLTLSRKERWREPTYLKAPRESVTYVCGMNISNGSRSMKWHKCGKPIKDEVRKMCGLHAGVENRMLRKEEGRQDKSAAAKAKLEEVRTELAKMGVDAMPVTNMSNDYISTYTGRVSLTMDELRRIVALGLRPTAG